MSPTVTIGAPTFPRADRFLRPELERALAQTRDDLEIIVSDNCLTTIRSKSSRRTRIPGFITSGRKPTLAPTTISTFASNRPKANTFLICGYARRFLPDRMERLKAYKMIERESDCCYSCKAYLFHRTITRRVQRARSGIRRSLNGERL